MTTSTQDFAVRTTIYTEELDGWGVLRTVPLVPAEDLDLIHGWVSQPRARFWGMLDHSREDILEIYEFLDSLDTHHAFLVVVDAEPLALFQTYEPLHDPVGEAYPAREEDIGMHLLLAPATRPIPNFTPRLVTSLIRYMFPCPARTGSLLSRTPATPRHFAASRPRASSLAPSSSWLKRKPSWGSSPGQGSRRSNRRVNARRNSTFQRRRPSVPQRQR